MNNNKSSSDWQLHPGKHGLKLTALESWRRVTAITDLHPHMKGFVFGCSPSTLRDEAVFLFSQRERERHVHPSCVGTRSADLDIANPNTDAPVLPSCGEQKETQCVQEAGADKGINPMTTNATIPGTSLGRKKKQKQKKKIYFMVKKMHNCVRNKIIEFMFTLLLFNSRSTPVFVFFLTLKYFPLATCQSHNYPLLPRHCWFSHLSSVFLSFHLPPAPTSFREPIWTCEHLPAWTHRGDRDEVEFIWTTRRAGLLRPSVNLPSLCYQRFILCLCDASLRACVCVYVQYVCVCASISGCMCVFFSNNIIP